MTATRVGIALGSNVGDRAAHLRSAVEGLREIAAPGEPFLEAGIHRTEPVGCPPGSPDFLNSVVEIGFAGTPSGLLERLRGIERALGRTASPERNAPRVIDLDVLYFGTETIATPALVVPHPRLAGRRFVLEPLAEIRPELVLPGQEISVAELLARL